MCFWIVLLRHGENTTRLRLTENPDALVSNGSVACIGGFKTEHAALQIQTEWQQARGLDSRINTGQDICKRLMLPFYVVATVKA